MKTNVVQIKTFFQKISFFILVLLLSFVFMERALFAAEVKLNMEMDAINVDCGIKSDISLDSFNHKQFVALKNVSRGDKLQGITRMSGNCMVLFNLEVMSVMESSSPGEGSILAEIKVSFSANWRTSGHERLACLFKQTLVGAVAYTVQNLKKPIVGITPINAMLRIGSYLPKEGLAANNVPTKFSQKNLVANTKKISFAKGLVSHKALSSEVYSIGSAIVPINFSKLGMPVYAASLANSSFKQNILKQNILLQYSHVPTNQFIGDHIGAWNGMAWQPIPVSIVISPMGSFGGVVNAAGKIIAGGNFKDIFAASNFFTGDKNGGKSNTYMGEIGGNSGHALRRREPLTSNASMEDIAIIPGDLVGVNLVRGDIDISAYGTVTHVDGNRVFAFGHPMDLAGPTAIPMYKAFVDSVVPRTDFSYKVGSLVAEIGSIVEDRKTAILGLRGKVSHRVPYSLLIDTFFNKKQLQFEITKGLKYGPEIMASLITYSLEQYESLAMRVPLSYSMDVHISLPSNETNKFTKTQNKTRKIQFKNTYPTQMLELTMRQMAAEVFEKLYILKENSFTIPSFDKIDIKIMQPEVEAVWAIDRVQLADTRVKQGDPINFFVVIKSYQGETKKLNVVFMPKKILPIGNHILHISSEETFLKSDRLRNPARYAYKILMGFCKIYKSKDVKIR